jgi:hypothetical protein
MSCAIVIKARKIGLNCQLGKARNDSVENITCEVMNSSFCTVLCLYLKICESVITQRGADDVMSCVDFSSFNHSNSASGPVTFREHFIAKIATKMGKEIACTEIHK